MSALVNGKESKSARGVQWYAQRRPDLWQYVEHSLILSEQGLAAAEFYAMPTHCPHWKAAQQHLAMLWRHVAIELQSGTIRVVAQLAQARQ